MAEALPIVQCPFCELQYRVKRELVNIKKSNGEHFGRIVLLGVKLTCPHCKTYMSLEDEGDCYVC